MREGFRRGRGEREFIEPPDRNGDENVRATANHGGGRMTRKSCSITISNAIHCRRFAVDDTVSAVNLKAVSGILWREGI